MFTSAPLLPLTDKEAFVRNAEWFDLTTRSGHRVSITPVESKNLPYSQCTCGWNFLIEQVDGPDRFCVALPCTRVYCADCVVGQVELMNDPSLAVSNFPPLHTPDEVANT